MGYTYFFTVCVSFFLFILSFGQMALGIPISIEAIYGLDDRKDVFEIQDSNILQYQRSVAAKVHKDRIEGGLLKGPILGKVLCPDVKFAEQPKVSVCSGFLVASNILVTAAHCMKEESDCKDFRWVFGFQKNSKDQSQYRVAEADIYSCSQVIEKKYSGFGAVDHAVIELTRSVPVEDRPPLSFRKDGSLSSEDSVLAIGHSMGLPAKVVAKGQLLVNEDKNFFETDLDTFGGSSGSPVFNERTGEVEGIVNRGHGDLVWGPGEKCKVIKVCEPGECHTSKAVRITNIDYIKNI